MLILLNIIIILFILGMAAIWATYGFFSSFIHLVIVIVAGTFAFALWEPLSFWLLGRMPATAWGVGLLAPFALGIIVLRVLFDKYCKMNLHFPRLADQLGGGACGVCSGILTSGILLIGAGFLMPTPIMGYAPYQMAGNGIETNDEGQLWPVTQVDQWAGGFFTMLSSGSMHPFGGTPLAEYKSDIADRAQVYHLTNDPNASKAAPPGSVVVLGAHRLVPDDFRDMVVLANYDALVTDQMDLVQADIDARARAGANPDDPTVQIGPYGGHYVDAILAEYARRQALMDDGAERTPENRPSALLNFTAMSDLAALFVPPADPNARGASGGGRGGRGGGRTGAGEVVPIPEGEGRGGGRADRGGRGDGTPEPGETAADEGGEDDNEGGESTSPSLLPLADLPAFFDNVIEKQVQPTIDAINLELARGGEVVVVDTQWSKEPRGSFDSDGWLRIAIPSIRLITRGPDGELHAAPPIGYSREVQQDTGQRHYVDLLSQTFYSADEQNDDVKLGWVFIIPAGHEPFRFEARQLGFDLDKPFREPIPGFVQLARMLGSVDVPQQAAPPEGIEIGDTGAVVELGERLPLSISPNNATSIDPNRDEEQWTAMSGEQRSILYNTGGGRRSRMRAVFVPEGSRLIQVRLTADADRELLGAARQAGEMMYIRDDQGAEHEAIGFALRRGDDSMHVMLRAGNIDAGRLARVGAGETLTVYFQVPVGVTATHFVVGDKDGEGIAFEENIDVVAR